MSRRPQFGKTKSIGYGFVFRWNDGTLGWALPKCLSWGNTRPSFKRFLLNEPMFLCKITVKQIFNKKGKPIIRYLKNN